MKTDANSKLSLMDQLTDRSHWPGENILPHQFPGEGNPSLPPSESFACFKCKSTGQWRSVPAAKWWEVEQLKAALHSLRPTFS